MKNTENTIIYLRTSTIEQNPENQLNDCLGMNKWGEYQVISEQQSAFKDFEQRDQFNILLSLIKKKKVSHLIVWDLDRIYRNRKKLAEFFQLCALYKCVIHSYRQNWLEELNKIPPPFDEIVHTLMLHIMGWIAEQESTHKSERIRASIRIHKDGAYSYKGNKWGRKRISTVKKNKIFEMRNNNMSMRVIAKELSISVGVVHKTLTESST